MHRYHWMHRNSLLLIVVGFSALASCSRSDSANLASDSDAGRSDARGLRCTDVAPGGGYSCQEQAGWGKCSAAWMVGYCQKTCGTCPEPVSGTLVDSNATPNARALMAYLTRMYGSATLAAQHDLDAATYMVELTGLYPAIVGFDLMDYSPSRVGRVVDSEETSKALKWSREDGGIVTFTWHWNAPAALVDSAQWPWWKGFYSEATTFDLPAALSNLSSPEGQLLLRDIDAIAAQLSVMQDAGVPVLWRPLHEASGGWFWWGAHGSVAYLKLYKLLYDRLVRYHGLHNLIWVWNGEKADWYPGDAYVDIIGEDIYDQDAGSSPHQQRFLAASARYTKSSKLVAMSETGTLPDPDDLAASSARWSWCMLWSGEFAIGETWNSDWQKRNFYASDFVITLDELPIIGD